MSGNGPGTPDRGGGGGGALDKFLTPESMLTPGGLGGITMVASNAIAHSFGLAESYISYIGILLSFVFGLLVLASAREWWLRAVYYLLNSLIIFVVAFGSGNLTAPPPGKASGGSSFNLVSFAYANDASSAGNSDAERSLTTLQANYANLNTQYNTEVQALTTLQNKGAPQSEIDKQNATIQDLQQKKDENLKLQANTIEQIRANSIASRPAVTNDSKAFFRQWTNPFR